MTLTENGNGTLPTELRLGNLEVRLARSVEDIDAVQALRYRVFYAELAANASAEVASRRRDFDDFDALCDHLMVIDHTLGEGIESVVGTYRLIRREAAQKHGSFFTADEFDVSPLEAYPGEILELGRSCVAPPYRNRPTMELLWRGIAAYVFHYGIELMFGCASFHGTDIESMKLPLSYLYYNHLAPPAYRARALEPFTRLDLLPQEAVDPKQALKELPPLLKGYLRLGGMIGDGAYIDHPFNTVDVCMVVKTDMVTDKYFSHYARVAGEGQTKNDL